MIRRYPTYASSVFVAINLMFITSSFFAICSEVSVPSIRPDTLIDPLFGIEYRPNEVHFDSAPASIYNCRDLEPRRGNLFLFGKVVKGNAAFYYVYGWEEVLWNGPEKGIKHFQAESDEGIIVVVSRDGCNYIGAGYAWSNVREQRQMAEKYGITDDVVSALINDAVNREVRAFGGKTEFLHRFDASGIDESKLLPQVRAKLAVLRGVKRNKSEKTKTK